MSPDPLVVATWSSDANDAQIVLYDDGVVKLHSGELVLELLNPWKTKSSAPLENEPQSDPEPGAG